MTSTIMPTLRYRDAAAAIDWLCDAFGFERHLVVPADDGTITHAQLVYDGGMMMLGQGRSNEYDELVTYPDEIGNKETQAPYLVVPNADAHYARAKAAGAEIVMDIEDQDHGGRAYACRDPEGHLWNVGDYDPWKVE